MDIISYNLVIQYLFIFLVASLEVFIIITLFICFPLFISRFIRDFKEDEVLDEKKSKRR